MLLASAFPILMIMRLRVRDALRSAQASSIGLVARTGGSLGRNRPGAPSVRKTFGEDIETPVLAGAYTDPPHPFGLAGGPYGGGGGLA